MGRRINPSGLVIAGIGFFATRFTVELALYEADPLRFYVAGILPLAVGLGLAAFGVALTILDVESDLVQTTAVWCVIGAASMFVFGVLTIYGNVAGLMSIEGRVFRSSLSNFLIGGSVGGTLTGIYAARSRQHRRQLRQHANRLVVLNRLLRHEVLNAITAIRGYTALGDEYGEEARDVIRDRSGAIERTIEKVKYLTRRADGNVDGTVPVDVSECIRAAIDDVEARHPQANVTVNGDQAGLEVLADEQLEDILSELIENAI
ncbi:MAG: histidine kinase, partial [Salinirussus sp.]